MTSKYIIKNLTNLFLLMTFFLFSNTAYAEFLSFKVGDKVSYTISQIVDVEYDFFGIGYSQSEAIIDVNIEILSCNPETGNYPYDVAVIIEKILITETQDSNSNNPEIVKYDSQNPKNIRKFSKQINKLINFPLNFKIEKDFRVEETTGYLKRIDKNYNSPFELGLFGATPWTFKLLLTQLFHCSGQDLLESNSYPTSCYQMLTWEDADLEEDEINVNQSSAYVIQGINANEIKATWEGDAIVVSEENDMNGKVNIKGNVTWDVNNPLIQNRTLEVTLQEKTKYFFGFFTTNIKLSARQTWQPKSS